MFFFNPIREKLRQRTLAAYARRSFSQDGEDVVLMSLLAREGIDCAGFFVDVGAFHPVRYSNTYLFYCQGWRGINIDASPGSMLAFQRLRPEDINLEIAIAESESERKLFLYNEPALNTFSEAVVDERSQLTNYWVESTQMVNTHTLSKVLVEYLPRDKEIDFLSVDVEGLDLEVLKSNDWARYRPRFVITEDLRAATLSQAYTTPTACFLADLGYLAVARTMRSTIFASSERAQELPYLLTANCGSAK